VLISSRLSYGERNLVWRIESQVPFFSSASNLGSWRITHESDPSSRTFELCFFLQIFITRVNPAN
jgi:hypothetical protein